MIKLQYKVIRDMNFGASLQKLKNVSFPSLKTTQTVLRISKAIQKEGEIVQEAFTKLIDTYAEKDAEGKLVPYEDRPGTFSVKKNIEGYQKSLKEFEDLTFEIDCPKIPLSELEGVKLNANDLEALEAFIFEEAEEKPSRPSRLPQKLRQKR